MGSNHYYLTNKFFKLDVIQALSKVGGVDPKYRNYILPVYGDLGDGLLRDSADNVVYYELVDKPYMKIVPEKKQNVKAIVVDEVEEDDDAKKEVLETEENDAGEEEKYAEFQKDVKTITKNLEQFGYTNHASIEEEEESKDEQSPMTQTGQDDTLQTNLLQD